MASIDAELEKQLKEAGKQLSRPSDSVDELLRLLDKVEKLLLKVDQSPRKSMLDALKPSMNALIKDSLSKHSDMDVKVAVASCISEITRITAPDAPYTDDQMRDVFELIVSCFEDLSDRSSRSYNKRALILETVSKVRSCVIMLDLECDELIAKMFEHFLKAVRDFHIDSVFLSMENIMVLVIDESEEIPVEMLKPLLASVKKDRVGVLPVAHKLAKGVLLKSAEKLKPYVMPALTSLGESLDTYHKVVAAICEGSTSYIETEDNNNSGPQLANECKVEKGSVDEVQQADESKLTTSSSDHVDQVVKTETCPKEEVDPIVENRSPEPVMSNGVSETVKEETSVDQEPKKVEEDKIQEPLNKEDTDDSDADKMAKGKSQTEKIPNKSETEADTTISSIKVKRSNKEKLVQQEVETAFPSKSRSPLDETRVNKETDVSKSALKSASREGNITETPGTSAKRKHSTSKDKVFDTVRYDESLVGTKVKVWWPEDNMYYKGVVAEFYPDKKKHKVSYVDGDEEILNLRTQHWKILKDSSLRDDKVQNVEVQSEEGSPDIHKKKKSKTDPAASQEKIKCSANKVGDVSSFGKSKGSTLKDNLSTQKHSGKSCDAATTASKEAAKSKEDEETLKVNTKTKTVNKSNGKTPPNSSKFSDRGPTEAEKLEYEKERLRLEAEKLKIKGDKGQSKIRLQDERLRLKAEKMKLLKKESDIRIMMIDARVMPEMQRLYFEELQKEIIMRRSHA